MDCTAERECRHPYQCPRRGPPHTNSHRSTSQSPAVEMRADHVPHVDNAVLYQTTNLSSGTRSVKRQLVLDPRKGPLVALLRTGTASLSIHASLPHPR